MEVKLLKGLPISVPRRNSLASNETVIRNEFSDLPGLGSDEYPGFSTDCPDALPNVTKHQSVMAVALRANPSIWTELRGKATGLGVTFGKCIKSGMDVLGDHR